MKGTINVILVLSPRDEMTEGKFRNEVGASRQKLIEHLQDEFAVHPRLFIHSSGCSIPDYDIPESHPCMWRGCDEIVNSDESPFCIDHGSDPDGEYPNFSYKKDVLLDGEEN